MLQQTITDSNPECYAMKFSKTKTEKKHEIKVKHQISNELRTKVH